MAVFLHLAMFLSRVAIVEGATDAAAAVHWCSTTPGEAGLGFGRFRRQQAWPAVRSKRLRVVLRGCERPPEPVRLVYAEARLMSARLRAFLDWMKQHLPDTPS